MIVTEVSSIPPQSVLEEQKASETLSASSSASTLSDAAPVKLRRYSIGDHSFIDDCIHDRLPKILESLYLDEHDDETKEVVEKWVQNVIEKINKGSHKIVPHPVDDEAKEEIPDWSKYDLGQIVGVNYDKVTWWAYENALYFELAKVSKFFENRLDYFKSHKEGALSGALSAFKPFKWTQNKADDIESLILRQLWGNRADLSLSAGEVDEDTLNASNKRLEYLLANDLSKISKFMTSENCKKVTIVLDNCGIELICDLDLTYYLLKNFPDMTVTMMCKVHPVFVSDALIADVHIHVDALQKKFPEQYKDFNKFIESGRFKVEEHEFYNSPLSGWEMPEDLHKKFLKEDIILIKGDANYRRLFGDSHLPASTNFQDFLQYWGDVKVAAIRTCKAPLVIGVDQETYEETSKKDPEWNLNGNWGFIQLKE